MKPIEPGCLAIHTYGRNAGMTVRCIRFVGRVTLASGGQSIRPDCWEVDRLTYWNASSKPSDPYASEKWLLRIDGHEEPTTTEKAVEA